MTFDRDYVRIVLNENFEDAKRLLIDPMLAIDEAHLVMLTDTGILSSADARALRAALATIEGGAGVLHQEVVPEDQIALFPHLPVLIRRVFDATRQFGDQGAA